MRRLEAHGVRLSVHRRKRRGGGAGTALAQFGEAIAQRTRVGRLWIGAVLLAGATSLPELGTDISATRMGALDLALGDLFGSSMANMAILLFVDLAHPSGSIFVDASRTHVLTLIFGVILMALGLAAIVYRAKKRFTMLEPDSALIDLTYVLAIWMLYLQRGGG